MLSSYKRQRSYVLAKIIINIELYKNSFLIIILLIVLNVFLIKESIYFYQTCNKKNIQFRIIIR